MKELFFILFPKKDARLLEINDGSILNRFHFVRKEMIRRPFTVMSVNVNLKRV